MIFKTRKPLDTCLSNILISFLTTLLLRYIRRTDSLLFCNLVLETYKLTASQKLIVLYFVNVNDITIDFLFFLQMGKRVSNILKHIFPVPKQDARRIVTFANQSDYISFR